MALYSVEVTGRNFTAEVEGTLKELEFLAIRIVDAENEKSAKSMALSEVLGLDQYAQLIKQQPINLPSLDVTEVELLSGHEANDSESTGLIFYDPNEGD